MTSAIRAGTVITGTNGVLLLRNADSGTWELPADTRDGSELPRQTAQHAAEQATGCNIAVRVPVSRLNTRIEHDSGSYRFHGFAGHITEGTPHPAGDRWDQASWFDSDAVARIAAGPVLERHRDAIRLLLQRTPEVAR